MKRRQFIRHLSASSAALSLSSARLFAAPEDYTGRLMVTLQAAGAWDVSSFCDPKANVAGQPIINNWASEKQIKTAGNINYADFANNTAFFEQFSPHMLVINGIDAQTNSHSTGVLHNWSGRNSAGYPSLTALFSAINAPDLPLAYMNFGGYSETARLIRYTRLNDINSLLGVLTPNTPTWNREARYRNSELLDRVLQKQQARLQRQRSASGLSPHQQYTMDAYYAARENAQGLQDFAQVIPESSALEEPVQVNREVNSNLRSQMQIALLAFQSGASCSADLLLNGFDTHADHDTLHEPLLAHMTDAISYFWDYAAQLGLADRITLMIASDFARTPYYNSSNGKDHWPIGSVVVMEQSPSWGNKVVGASDQRQNALKVNPTNLALDEVNGITLYPKHIHHAMRQLLNIDEANLSMPFTFSGVENLNIFS